MHEDTRKRLDRAIRIERLRKAIVVLPAAAVVGLIVAYQVWDAQVKNTLEPGTITGITPAISKPSNADGETIHVHLDSGPAVNVLALKTRRLHVGDHIQVTAHHHGTGRVTYSLK